MEIFILGKNDSFSHLALKTYVSYTNMQGCMLSDKPHPSPGKWLKEVRCGILIQCGVLAGGLAVKYQDCYHTEAVLAVHTVGFRVLISPADRLSILLELCEHFEPILISPRGQIAVHCICVLCFCISNTY